MGNGQTWTTRRTYSSMQQSPCQVRLLSNCSLPARTSYYLQGERAIVVVKSSAIPWHSQKVSVASAGQNYLTQLYS
jgi:hypothetical protein